MKIIPAIDIKGGKCVRLLQGDPDKETIYSDNPVEMAQSFEKAGASLIHIVDLDGAFSGDTVNRVTVTEIAGSINVPIEIGGGIRTEEAINFYQKAGIDRIILGTAILDRESEHFIEKYTDIIVAGIDARDSMVATHGWKQVSSMKAQDVIGEIIDRGINDVIYTDIATDGMLRGPNFEAIEEILKQFNSIRLIASGGVSTMNDLKRLSGLDRGGPSGVIVGKAIYDGKIDLHEALEQFT